MIVAFNAQDLLVLIALGAFGVLFLLVGLLVVTRIGDAIRCRKSK